MLRWQLQKLHDRTRFITKLLGVSVALHVGACLSLFFYQASGGKITFDTKRMLGRDVIVKVVPFGQKKPVSSTTKAVVARGSKNLTAKKTSVAAVKKTEQKKVPVKKQDKKTSLVQKKTATKKATKTQAKKQKEEPAKKKIEKAAAVAEQVTKKEVAPVQEVQKTPEKKELTPEPITQPAVAATEVPQQPLSEVPAVQPIAASETQHPVAEENVLYVDQAELAEIEIQRLLAEAITQAWNPPVGIPAHAVCQAVIEVDWQGNITTYKLTQTSGIMIYDVSVEEGIKALTLPRPVWGKTIELIFKPWTEA